MSLLLLLSTVLLTSCGFEVVDQGYVGVKKSLGKIEMEEYQPGVHFYNPFTTGIFEMEVREQKWSEKATGYTKDVQNVDVYFTLNYRPIQTHMAEFYSEYGEEYGNKIIPQIVFARTKEVVGQFDASDLVSKRNVANDLIKKAIIESLKEKNLIVESFELTNLDFDDAYEQAIKDKVIAKERAVEELNRTVQVQEQAKQKVMSEKAEAEAIMVKAQALSKNKDLIQLEAVKKWNGTLPNMMMGGSVPFLNLSNFK